MGKTKWYAETENSTDQPRIRVNSQSSREQRRTSAPGRLFQEPLEAVPLRVLLRQIVIRVRRNWVALRFQANRYTFGVFKKQTALRLGGLAFAAYVLLFSDREYWIFSENPVRAVFSGRPVETSLRVEEYDGPKPSRSILGNEAAPLAVYDLRQEQAQDYINRFSKIAVLEMKKFGIPASISLAQGLVESRSGTSKLAKQNNNHFGIKCFSKKCREGHCTNFSDDHHKDFFRKFVNPWESWRAHSMVLANGRYTRLKKYGRNYLRWAQGLEQLGYATDRSYSEKLIGVIEKYDLKRFDSE